MSAGRSYEVFVRGIPWTFSKKELAQYCSQFGKVVSAHVSINKETGMHNGFGFVNFKTKDAISKLNGHGLHFAEGSAMHFDARSRQERLGRVLPENETQ